MPDPAGRFDAIVVGAGHNGLVAAAYLARAGWRVAVLERRGIVGGACVTEQIFPGYRVSTAAYLVSLLQEKVVRDLELRRFGYEVSPKDPAYFAPYPDGRHFFMYLDADRTRAEIARFSPRDAERYGAYNDFVERMARFVEPMLLESPPDLPPRRPADLAAAARLAIRLARLGRGDLGRLLELMTASVRQVLDRWFESDQLKVALATDGLIGTNGGPASPGTAYVLLHHVMGGVGGVRGLRGFVRGGMGAVSEALRTSAESAGALVLTDAPVERIVVRDGRARGVATTDGREFPAAIVLSCAEPTRTLLGLVGREHLPSDLVERLDGYKCVGSSFKINLALGELPSYVAVPGAALGPQHKGTTHLCPSLDYAERAWDDAKYGRPSDEPLVEITIPTAYDPTLAPPGRHIMSLFVQYAPYRLREGTWDDRKEAFVRRAIDLVGRYAPNLPGAIEHVHALSPLDLEREFGLTGGNIFHGELSLDQLFSARPALGWARYATPIGGLYLCGSGTHPGGGVTGAPGHNAAREVLSRHRLRRRP